MSQEITIVRGWERPTWRCAFDQEYTLSSDDLIMPEQIKALRAEGKIGYGQGYTIGIQYVTQIGSGPLAKERYLVVVTDHVDASD
jgi:hypothetical protein